MNTQINVSLSVNRHEKWPNGSQCCVTDTTLHNPIRQSVELCSHVLAWKHKLEQSHRSVSFIMVSKRRTRRVCAAAQPAWCLPAQSISCRDGGIKRRPNKTLSRDRGVLGQREGHRFGTGKWCRQDMQICGANCLLQATNSNHLVRSLLQATKCNHLLNYFANCLLQATNCNHLVRSLLQATNCNHLFRSLLQATKCNHLLIYFANCLLQATNCNHLVRSLLQATKCNHLLNYFANCLLQATNCNHLFP